MLRDKRILLHMFRRTNQRPEVVTWSVRSWTDGPAPLFLAGIAAAEPLPAGFVYLRDVDPTIVWDHPTIGELADGISARLARV